MYLQSARREGIPVHLRTVDLGAGGPLTKVLLGDLDGDGRLELVTVQGDSGVDARYFPHQVHCLTAFDLDGNLLWQVGEPTPEPGSHGSDFPAQIWDFDGDGRNEVVCVMEKRFKVLDGATGATKREHALPDPEAHDCIIAADLAGRGWPGDVLLKDRYRRMWALDQEFNLLWTHEGNTGHYPWVYDFDGDGKTEVMAGYDLLDHDGTRLWSCRDLDGHADCIWVGDVNGDGEPEIAIGEGGVYLYDRHGAELWRNREPREVQHIALGRFRPDLPGLQVAGLDRIVRGGRERPGKDGMFLLDSNGRRICVENRATDGWLTIIEPLSHWDSGALDYILAWRRGGGVTPALYDGELRPVVVFPVDGYVVHADLLGTGRESVIICDERRRAHIFASEPMDLSHRSGKPLPQPKRLAASTLYPGGEV